MTFSPPSARSRRSTFWAVMALAVMAIFAFSGSAGASPLDTSGTASPWIQSDQADYAPGSTVTLTGGGFDANEAVHINVNDTLGKTWSRNVDVTADGSGGITDVFSLPNTFVSDYDVTATGMSSGAVATTTFTDANVNVKTSGVASATVTWARFSNSTCQNGSGQPIASGSISAVSGGNGTGVTGGVSSGESLRLTAGAVSGATFSNWSNGAFTTGDPTTANPVCLASSGNSTQNIILTYTTSVSTTTTLSSSCLLYTSPSPRDGLLSRMPSSA